MSYSCASCGHSAALHAVRRGPGEDECMDPCSACDCQAYDGPLDVDSAGDAAAPCDVCEARPGTHSLMASGTETWACDECSSVEGK